MTKSTTSMIELRVKRYPATNSVFAAEAMNALSQVISKLPSDRPGIYSWGKSPQRWIEATRRSYGVLTYIHNDVEPIEVRTRNVAAGVVGIKQLNMVADLVSDFQLQYHILSQRWHHQGFRGVIHRKPYGFSIEFDTFTE